MIPSKGLSSTDDGLAGQYKRPWEIHFTQPADDSTISRGIKTVFHQIELHVENFYSDTAATQITEAIEAAVTPFDTGLLPTPLKVTMQAAKSKRAVIKQCLAHLIISRINTESLPDHSFLPPEIATLPSLLARTDSNKKSKPGNFFPPLPHGPETSYCLRCS
jgi:hypothetical protein